MQTNMRDNMTGIVELLDKMVGNMVVKSAFEKNVGEINEQTKQVNARIESVKQTVESNNRLLTMFIYDPRPDWESPQHHEREERNL